MAISSIECYRISGEADWDKVLALPRAEVSVDWCGGTLARPYRFSVGIDDRYLLFVADVPFVPPASQSDRLGCFVVDLAEPETKGQTAGLFVMGHNDAYFEIQVSHDGAWWYMDFPGYRQRLPRSVLAGVEVQLQQYERSWTGAIRIPREMLSVAVEDGVRGEATLSVCDRPNPLYITSAGSREYDPDFHDERSFSCLRIID
jgi:hypothetical protein